MTVSLQALNRVLCFEVVLLNYLTEKVSVIGHLLKSWVKTRLSVSWGCYLFEPRMLSNNCNSGSLFGISVQNLCKEVSAFV